MMKLLLPLILVAVAGVVFFQLTDPILAQVDELKIEQARLNEGLDNAKALRRVLEELLATYNSFNQADLERLNKFLPDNVDNVRLIIDINSIARPYNMTIRDLKIKADEDKGEASVIEGGDKMNKGAITLGFAVTGSYANLQAFLSDLAKSLRLVDISAVNFKSTPEGFYEYNIEIQTYWLK